MKIRTSFVSNSSSSSFVILTTSDDIEKAWKWIDKPSHKKVLTEVFLRDKKKVKIDGNEKILYMGEYSTDSFYDYSDEECESDEMLDVADRFFKALKINPSTLAVLGSI